MDHPVGEPIPHETGELFDLHGRLIEDELAGLAVAGQVENAVAAAVLELVEVVAQLFFRVTGQVRPFDVVDALAQLEQGDHAQAGLDVAVPQRLHACDLLAVACRPSHDYRRPAAWANSERLPAKASTTPFMSSAVSVPMFETRNA